MSIANIDKVLEEALDYSWVIGKPLNRIYKRLNILPHGYCVFLLKDEEDTTGTMVGENCSICPILREHPELNCAVVKYTNFYFGQVIFRVILPDQEGRGDNAQ